MAWNNARSKYSKNIVAVSWTGPDGFANFLAEMGPKPQGSKLAVDERGEYYWRANPTSRKQSAATLEVSGPPVSTSGAGPAL